MAARKLAGGGRWRVAVLLLGSALPSVLRSGSRERVIFDSFESFFLPKELDCFKLPPSVPSAPTASADSARGVDEPLLRLPRPKEEESLRPLERGDSIGCVAGENWV